MVIEMAPSPRNAPSLKQLAFVIVSSILIGAITVTATWKGAPSHALNIGVTVQFTVTSVVPVFINV